jgi:Tfp pilus assembly protein PilV
MMKRPTLSSSLHRPQRGVSLIEALVAFAVMAFGMLGVVGMQTSLRVNADVSKQRSQAVRIAQEAMEEWRAFPVLTAVAPAKAFDNIAGATQTDVTMVAGTTNTTYRITRTVSSPSPVERVLIVDVEWADRSGTTQPPVRLASTVTRIEPALAGSVTTPGAGLPTRNPGDRHRGIPPGAKNFGDGTSGFKPPQGSSGNEAWRFNNSTGVITVCTTSVATNDDITQASDLNCPTGSGIQLFHLLQGYMRFATSATQPLEADTTDANAVGVDVSGSGGYPRFDVSVAQTAPTGLTATPRCFRAPRNGGTFREYFCAVPIANEFGPWSGTVRFANAGLGDLASNAADVRVDRFKICRYRATGPYTNVNQPRLNQNYLIIRAGNGTTAFTCPTSGSGPTWFHGPPFA